MQQQNSLHISNTQVWWKESSRVPRTYQPMVHGVHDGGLNRWERDAAFRQERRDGAP